MTKNKHFIIERKENFPAAGEAYVIGKLGGRYFFSWGSVYPFVNDLPEKDVRGKSGIQWFDSEEEAFKAAKTRQAFDYLFRLSG